MKAKTICAIDLGPRNTGIASIQLYYTDKDQLCGWSSRLSSYRAPEDATLPEIRDGICGCIPEGVCLVLIEEYKIRSLKKSSAASDYITLQGLISDRIREGSPADVLLIPERSWRAKWASALLQYADLEDDGSLRSEDNPLLDLGNPSGRTSEHARDAWQMLLSYIHEAQPAELKAILRGGIDAIR